MSVLRKSFGEMSDADDIYRLTFDCVDVLTRDDDLNVNIDVAVH